MDSNAETDPSFVAAGLGSPYVSVLTVIDLDETFNKIHNHFEGDVKVLDKELTAILKDEKSLAELVKRIPEEDIQRLLDVIQALIDDVDMPTIPYEKSLAKVVECTGAIPRTMSVPNAKKDRACPAAGGSQADVWKGSVDGKDVSLRVIRLLSQYKDVGNIRGKILKEALGWRHLSHPNILPFTGVSDTVFEPTLTIVSPWMAYGSVTLYLDRFRSANRLKLILGIAYGMQYLHGLSPCFIHGCLRADSVLVNEDGTPKISIYELDRIVGENWFRNLRWECPELLLLKKRSRSDFTMASDVYAFASTCIEIFTGEVPLSKLSDEVTHWLVAVTRIHPPRPENAAKVGLSDDMWSLMTKCWAHDPEDRPSIQELVVRIIALEEEFSRERLRYEVETLGLIIGGDLKRNGSYPVFGGGFADVWRGGLGGKHVALKTLRFFSDHPSDYDSNRRELCKEAIIWKQLSHPNILPFIGVCDSIFYPNLAIISPWMENGNIYSYLKNHPNADRAKLVLSLSLGMQYLHNLQPKVVHGDLRASNVLVDEDGSPKISDFGLAKIIISNASTTSSFGGQGNQRWQAPELLNPSQFEGVKVGFTTKTDVYAFASVCLEIFTEKVPYAELSDVQALMEVAVHKRHPSRPPEPAASRGLSDRIWEIMQSCWAFHPEKRLDMNGTVNALQAISSSSPTLVIEH